jgi:hypothetical protein
MAAAIFSLTIRSASRRARLPPRISFIIRSAMTPFASTANIIKELNMRHPLHNCPWQNNAKRMIGINPRKHLYKAHDDLESCIVQLIRQPFESSA